MFYGLSLLITSNKRKPNSHFYINTVYSLAPISSIFPVTCSLACIFRPKGCKIKDNNGIRSNTKQQLLLIPSTWIHILKAKPDQTNMPRSIRTYCCAMMDTLVNRQHNCKAATDVHVVRLLYLKGTLWKSTSSSLPRSVTVEQCKVTTCSP